MISIFGALALKLARMPSSAGVFFLILFQAWFTVKYDKYLWRVYAKATALPCSVGVYFQTYSKNFIMVLEYNMHYYNTVPDDWPIGTKGE